MTLVGFHVSAGEKKTACHRKRDVPPPFSARAVCVVSPPGDNRNPCEDKPSSNTYHSSNSFMLRKCPDKNMTTLLLVLCVYILPHRLSPSLSPFHQSPHHPWVYPLICSIWTSASSHLSPRLHAMPTDGYPHSNSSRSQ